MSIDTPISELDADNILESEQFLVDWLQSEYSHLNLDPGTVLRDVVVKLYATLEERTRERMLTHLRSNSLLEIRNNPDLADDAQVDRLLSNYNITRKPGGLASGKVRVFLSSSNTVVLSNSTIVSIGGVSFRPISNFVASLNPGDSPTSKQIVPATNNLFTFVIDVVAVDPGTEGNVRANTSAAITPKVPNIVSARADEDFVGGGDRETNAQLISRLDEGISSKILENRTQIAAKIKKEFPQVVSVSSVGMADSPMVRDVSPGGSNQGGKVDIYVRTARFPLLRSIDVDAVLTDVATKKARIQVGPSVMSGAYTIEGILPRGSTNIGSMKILNESRGVSLPTSGFVPSVKNLVESGYSSFQTLTLDFVYEGNVVNLSTGDTVPVTLHYLQAPDISEIQNYVSSPMERNLGADHLVKAPVPGLCLVEVRLIDHVSEASSLDLVKIKKDVTEAVNRIPIGQRVPASLVASAIHSSLPDGISIDLPIHLWAVIRYPDNGEVKVLSSSDSLEAPYDPERGVHPLTTAFYLDTSSVDIQVVSKPSGIK